MSDQVSVEKPSLRGNNILIFFDGTGQAGGLRPDENQSNIYKLYRATAAARIQKSILRTRWRSTTQAWVRNPRRSALHDASLPLTPQCREPGDWVRNHDQHHRVLRRHHPHVKARRPDLLPALQGEGTCLGHRSSKFALRTLISGR
jgi:hypothetical protein